MRLSPVLKMILAAVGLALFALLIWKVGPSTLVLNIHRLGWGLLGVIAIGGLAHATKAWAWRFTFEPDCPPIPFLHLLGVRLAGEGVCQLSFAGQVAGETTRALVMKTRVPLIQGAASVVLDRGMFIFTSLIVILSGVVLSVVSLKVSTATLLFEWTTVLLIAGMLLLLVLAVDKRWPVLSASLRSVGRIRALESFARARRSSVHELEEMIWSFHERSGIAFWSSFSLNLLGHLLSVLEVWLVLWLLNLQPTFLLAFVVEVLIKVLNVSSAVMPGNLGIYEGGIMLILRSQGLSADTGLTLAIARRIRALFWTAVGLLFLALVCFRSSGGPEIRAPVLSRESGEPTPRKAGGTCQGATRVKPGLEGPQQEVP